VPFETRAEIRRQLRIQPAPFASHPGVSKARAAIAQSDRAWPRALLSCSACHGVLAAVEVFDRDVKGMNLHASRVSGKQGMRQIFAMLHRFFVGSPEKGRRSRRSG
jgi:hypothetical protein